MSGKAEKLQDAIGLIDDGYILEAHEGDAAASGEEKPGVQAKAVLAAASRRRTPPPAAPIALAACLVLAVGVGVFALNSAPAPTADEAAPTAAEELKDTSAEPDSVAMEPEADGEVGLMAMDDGAATSSNLAPGHPQNDFVDRGEAFILTGAEWNDNANWAFFMNLVNSDVISFPSYGIDPTRRVKVTVTDWTGAPLRNQTVELRDESGRVLWTAESGKDGAAYLFYRAGQRPATVVSNGVEQRLLVTIEEAADGQGQQRLTANETIEDAVISVGAADTATAGLQVMFIVDTTGSMSDEIAYLQQDFASIAGAVGNDGVEYSVNFYRDEGDAYVTKCNGFTNDVSRVQAQLNRERAQGGGDTPEAVAQILTETITENQEWRDDCNKLAFLIFDAPPHDGTDYAIDAAVRAAAERGIRLVPVVASNAERDTELFGRALAICTGGTYVFLTDDSGVGNSHLEPIVGDYDVELLHDVIVRIINDNR